MLMAETPYHDRLMDLLTPEDAAWITEDERINGDIEQVRYSFDIKLSDDAIQRVLNDIYAKCEMA